MHGVGAINPRAVDIGLVRQLSPHGQGLGRLSGTFKCLGACHGIGAWARAVALRCAREALEGQQAAPRRR